MKKFNINDFIYIQITKIGWDHLTNEVGTQYMENCIIPHEVIIDGESWYRLQAHEVMTLFGNGYWGHPLFNTNIMIDEDSIS